MLVVQLSHCCLQELASDRAVVQLDELRGDILPLCLTVDQNTSIASDQEVFVIKRCLTRDTVCSCSYVLETTGYGIYVPFEM